MCSSDVFLGVLAILFPPLPVWVKTGLCSVDSLINLLLCILGFIPGLLHAWYIIAKFPEPSYDYQRVPHQSPEDGHTSYVIVRDTRPGHQQAPPTQPQPSYGTANASSSTPAGAAPKPLGPAIMHGEGSSGHAAPPSYAAAVAGDNKVQTHD